MNIFKISLKFHSTRLQYLHFTQSRRRPFVRQRHNIDLSAFPAVFAKSIGTNEFLFQETEPCVLFHRNVQRNKCSSGNPKTSSRSTPASTAAATTPPTVVASTVFASRNRKRTRWYPQHNRGWSHFRSYKCTALRPKNTTDR